MTNTILKLQNIHNHERNNIFRDYVYAFCCIIRDAFKPSVHTCVLYEVSKMFFHHEYSSNIYVTYKEFVHPITKIYTCRRCDVYNFKVEMSLQTEPYNYFNAWCWHCVPNVKEQKLFNVKNILKSIFCDDLSQLVLNYYNVYNYEHEFIIN